MFLNSALPPLAIYLLKKPVACPIKFHSLDFADCNSMLLFTMIPYLLYFQYIGSRSRDLVRFRFDFFSKTTS